jgi:hypothetical protein
LRTITWQCSRNSAHVFQTSFGYQIIHCIFEVEKENALSMEELRALPGIPVHVAAALAQDKSICGFPANMRLLTWTCDGPFCDNFKNQPPQNWIELSVALSHFDGSGGKVDPIQSNVNTVQFCGKPCAGLWLEAYRQNDLKNLIEKKTPGGGDEI